MSRTPLVVLVLVDALGHERVGDSGFLAAELPHRRPLETVLGFSAGAIPALLSGTWPAENGHWVMFHRDPKNSPFGIGRWLARAPRRVRDSWRVRQWVKESCRGAVGGYFDLYEVPWSELAELDVCERANLYAPGGLGAIGTLFDDAAERRLTTRVWDWRSDDAANERAFVDTVIAAAQDPAGQPELLFWYTPSVDALMHTHGVHAPVVEDRLARLADAIRRALAGARAHGREVWLYLVSDHGMADVTSHVDVMARVAASGLAPGLDYHAFYDSTLARFWFASPLAEAAARRALEGLPGRFLERQDEERWGIHFADRRYGEAIWLIDEGGLIVPSYMGSKPVKAMHGYDPATLASQATFLSNRPLPTGLSHIVDVRAFLAGELDARAAAGLPVRAAGGARP
ncbi:MAG: alkaline phosphatase family protein [Candidatus Eisenbacteria bacterium]